MKRAVSTDKENIVKILAGSFNANQSVNYLIKQDSKREQRIKHLMEYAFDMCSMFGDVFITDDKRGCALLIYPDKKRTSVKSILLDIKFILTCLGVRNIKKAISREVKINAAHPRELIYYLWFIGVDSNNRNKGVGSDLMINILKEADKLNRTICLETSTLKNLPWYEKFGFTTYQQFDFGYPLFCMKREYLKPRIPI